MLDLQNLRDVNLCTISPLFELAYDLAVFCCITCHWLSVGLGFGSRSDRSGLSAKRRALMSVYSLLSTLSVSGDVLKQKKGVQSAMTATKIPKKW